MFELTTFADAMSERREPWLCRSGGSDSGKEIVDVARKVELAPQRKPRVLRVAQVDSMLVELLSTLFAGGIPILWPSRIPVPQWLQKQVEAISVHDDCLRDSAGDPVIGVPTSGSSGSGKIVFLSQHRCLANAEAIINRLENDGKKMLRASLRNPAYAAALVGDVFTSLKHRNVRLLVHSAPPMVAARKLEAYGVTAVHGTAALLGAIKEDLPETVKHIVVSGDRLSIPDREGLLRAGKRRLFIGYGMSEAGPRITTDEITRDRPDGWVGRPLEGVRVGVESDELVIESDYAAVAQLSPDEGLKPVHGMRIMTGDRGEYDGSIVRVFGRLSDLGTLSGVDVNVSAIETVCLKAGLAVTASVENGCLIVTSIGRGRQKEGERTVRNAIAERFPMIVNVHVRFVDPQDLTEAGKSR